MIRTAVIGYGLSATAFHLPFIASDSHFRLVGISTSRVVDARTEWPNVKIFPTGEELISAGEADLIVITAPNAAHFPLARAALEAGCHVVLEKPVVNTLAEGKDLAALAERMERLLVPFHNRRWDGDYLTVARLITEGRLGEVRWFESHFDRFRPQAQDKWREHPGPGAGAWFDLGPHLVDQALCLFGPPQAVTGRCLSLREGARTTDNFHVLLHYPDLEVALHGSTFCAGPNIRFQVQGTEGSYVKYGLDPQEERLKAGIRPDTPDWAAEQPPAFGSLYTAGAKEVIRTETGGYQNFYRLLAAAADGKAAVPVAMADALVGIAVILLAEESSRRKETLPFE